MIKSKILYKGLAFILLPLALQIVAFVGLYSLTQRLERLAEDEAHMVKVVAWINIAMSQFVEGWTSIGAFVNSAGERTKATPEGYRQQTDRLFDEGRGLFGDDPGLKAMMDDCIQIRNEQVAEMKFIGGYHNQLQGILGMVSTLASLKPSLDKLYDHTRSLQDRLQEQRNATMAALEAERATRSQIKTMVVFGICAAVLLTFGMLIFFLNNITNRLTMLVSNARLIPTLQKLDKKVPGSDELAYLDSVIHEASDELRTASENRKQLMGMVAHDLRNPLVSAKMTLDGIAGRASKEAQSDLVESVRSGVGRVLTLLEDLLTIDKLEAGKLEIVKEPVEIKPVIADVFETMSGYAKSQQVELLDKTDAIVVEADR